MAITITAAEVRELRARGERLDVRVNGATDEQGYCAPYYVDLCRYDRGYGESGYLVTDEGQDEWPTWEEAEAVAIAVCGRLTEL